jgi:hypothetical protein
MGVSLGSALTPIDLLEYSGISYSYKGGAHRVQLQTTEVLDYDYYGVSLPASATWKTVTLPFKAFTQEDWGIPVAFDPSHILGVDYLVRGATGASGTFAVDKFNCFDLSKRQIHWILEIVNSHLEWTSPDTACGGKSFSIWR